MDGFHLQATEFLDLVGDYIAKVPAYLVVTGLSLFSSTVADDVRDKYMLHYWLTFTAGFGGGTASALLLMHAQHVTIPIFKDYVDIIFTVCWWMSNYFPYNIPGRILRMWIPTECTKILLMIAIGKVISHRVDMALTAYPSATIAAIFIGCVAGSGGKIINDMIRGGYHISKDLDEVRAPGISVNRAIAASTLYYVLVHVYHALTPRQGTALLILLLIAHTLILDLTGINPLQPVITGFHTILNIPQPMPVSKKPGNAKPSVSGSKKIS